MGIYDRDYYREPQSRYTLRGPRTIIGTLILINVVVFLADGLLTSPDPSQGLGDINRFLAVKIETLTKPWLWWQFVTYGFAHASAPEYWHILGNMLVLFFLGRDIEGLYGRKEFLRLYLATLVVAGVIWAVVGKIQGVEPEQAAVGASGAIAGVVVLYALNFPRRILLLFFVIPMPAWAVGMLVVVLDLLGALGYSGTHVAYTAHLAGAAFGFLYYQFGWNLSRWTSGWFSGAWLKSRPKLRVHDPDRRSRRDKELGDEVDRILEKIHREGEDSLTRKERRILENASREYQKKRQGTDDDGP
jgi:membrane associated rhomboid family serine protease